MLKKRQIICLFLISLRLSFGPVFAQAPREYAFLTTADGMVSNLVTCLHQDGKGYLWIGTEQGLSRYDGKTFRNFFLADDQAEDRIEGIYAGRPGKLYILCRINRSLQDTRHQGAMILKCYDQGTFESIGPESGLEDPFVTCLTEDRSGVLWIGTTGGIFRSKEHRFERVALQIHNPAISVTVIREDEEGVIWAGTQTEGLIRIDRNGGVTFFTGENGLPDQHVTALAVCDGTLWVGTKNQAARMDGARLIQVKVGQSLIDRLVYQIEIDRNRAIWFRCGRHGLTSWLNGELKFWGEREGLDIPWIHSLTIDRKGTAWVLAAEELYQLRGRRFKKLEGETLILQGFTAILADREDILWIGSKHGLIKGMAGNFSRYIALSKPESTAEAGRRVPSKIFADNQGHLYFPVDDGLASWNGSEFKRFEKKEGFVSASIDHVAVKGDYLFIFTSDGHLCWIHNNRCHQTRKISIVSAPFTTFIDDQLFFQDYLSPERALYCAKTSGDLLTIEIPAETDDFSRIALMEKDKQGSIYALSTGGKLYVLENGGMVVSPMLKGEDSRVYHMFRDKNSRLWLTTDMGLIMFDGEKQIRPLRQAPADKYAGSIAFFHDSSDRIWIKLGQAADGGRNGEDKKRLFAWWHGGKTSFLPDSEKIRGRQSGNLCFEDRDGKIWLSTDQEILCFDGRQTRIYPFGTLGIRSVSAELAFQSKTGNLWFPANRGVLMIEKGRAETFNLSNGLGGNQIQTLLEDRKGNLWFALENSGITRYSDGTFVNYTRKDGLSDNNIEDMAIDPTGHLWIRTESGIDRYQQTAIRPLMGDLEVRTEKRRMINPSSFAFTPKEKTINFTFTGLNFRTPAENLLYSYYLEGVEDGWLPYGSQKNLRYPNLASGEYIFRVRAMNRDMMESKVTAFTFKIPPPWWRTWWFYLLCFLVLSATGRSFYKRKVKSLEQAKVEALRRQKENLERQRIRHEIEEAQKIQLSLLPDRDPKLQGFHFASMTKPAVEVGGDYYDYIVLSETKLAVAIGDVSGHGIPSGLLMSMAKSSLHTNLDMLNQVGPIMRSLGKIIHQFSQDEKLMFMSFLFSVIDAEKKELTLAIAGHPPLYHYHGHDHKISEIGKGHYPLGINAVPEFDERIVSLDAGDIIMYYTDGIPERRNKSGHVFGYERLSETLSRHAHEEVHVILRNILEDLSNFAADIPADDDMTMVIVKVD